MEFGLAIIITSEVDNKSTIIQSLSDDLKLYFRDKQYGSDVKSYTIGVHCKNVPPGFEKFSQLPKPKYTKGKKVINPDGIPFTLEDSFEYSIKIDFNTFKNGTEEECRKILAKEILTSLDILDEMKAKIKDFNADKFKMDLEGYLKKEKLIHQSLGCAE